MINTVSIDKLKQNWERLYGENKVLFPYSSYEYNYIISKYKYYKLDALKEDSNFYVYKDSSNKIKVIFPLTIKGDIIILFGDNVSGAGHLDVIYGNDTNYNDFAGAFKELRERFEGKKLEIHKLNESSNFLEFLKGTDLFDDINISVERECVKIVFADDYDEYYKTLSKSVRQNIRTSYNKMNKNNIVFELKVFSGQLDDKRVLGDIMRIYTKREFERKDKAVNKFKAIKNRYFNPLVWAMKTMQSQYTFVLYIENKATAFMTGFKSNSNSIVFPMLAIDSDYSKYMPGKLMINEAIKYLINNSSIRVLDLSRGTEKYKLDMGGIIHKNYCVDISL